MIARLLFEILKELYRIRVLMETESRIKINDANAEKHCVSVWNSIVSKEYETEYNNKYKRENNGSNSNIQSST